MPRLFEVWVENLLLPAFFSWKSLGYTWCALVPCAEQSFTKIAMTQFEKFSGFQVQVIIYAKMTSKLYTIISNKLWDSSLYLSAFKSPSHEKSIFLKIRGFFSFKFFQGHNWLTKCTIDWLSAFRNSLNLISGLLFTGVSNRSRNFVILTMNKKNPQVKRAREAGHNIRFT